MSKILIKHGDVITLDDDGRLLFDADIAVEDGAIVAVGTAPASFAPDATVDARGHIVMPALFNAHTHSPMALFRGWAPAESLDAWLEDPEWLSRSGLTGEDVYWGAALAACEMIRDGVAGFADQYFFMDRVAEVVLRSGLRANLSWCTFGLDKEIGRDLPGISAFVAEYEGAGAGRIHTALGPHSPVECSPVFLARTAAVAARLGSGIHLHLAHSQRKAEYALGKYGMTQVEMLNRNGVLDVPVLAAHAIYLTEIDREILASKGVVCVQCPTYQARRGLGATPVADLRASGVSVALGSERPTVSGRFDMLHEARLAALLQPPAGGDALVDQSTLRMATHEAARALGFGQSGVIAPGYASDLMMINRDTARLCGGQELVETVLFSAQSGDVSDLMVAGEWLMRDRRLLTLDEDAIMDEAQRRGRRLVASMV
jgi:5-methylthioadenosine/S-adenosylhomocysteine deaminase